MDEPKFIKSDRYYYDVENKIIYGKKKYSYSYFHEYSHYKTMSKKGAYKFYCELSGWIQSFMMIAPLYFLFMVFIINESDYFRLTNPLIIVLMIFGSIILSLEISAYIGGYILWKKHKKQK